MADLVREFLASHSRLWIAGHEEGDYFAFRHEAWTRWCDSEFESGAKVYQVSLVDTGRCPLAVVDSFAIAGCRWYSGSMSGKWTRD